MLYLWRCLSCLQPVGVLVTFMMFTTSDEYRGLSSRSQSCSCDARFRRWGWRVWTCRRWRDNSKIANRGWCCSCDVRFGTWGWKACMCCGKCRRWRTHIIEIANRSWGCSYDVRFGGWGWGACTWRRLRIAIKIANRGWSCSYNICFSGWGWKVLMCRRWRSWRTIRFGKGENRSTRVYRFIILFCFAHRRFRNYPWEFCFFRWEWWRRRSFLTQGREMIRGSEFSDLVSSSTFIDC